MSNVYNVQCYSFVQRDTKKQILAQTHYSSTDKEIKVMLWCDVNTFIINRAVWEIYRFPGKPAGSEELSRLRGVTAYFGCGDALREKLTGDTINLKYKMLSETITAMIHAEFYLLSERGYVSLSVYDRYWDEMYAGSCHYYSNLDRVTEKLTDYLKDYTNLSTFFSRQRYVNIKRNTLGKILVNSSLNDFYHEMNVLMEINKDNFILENVSAEILRAPDLICKEAVLPTVNLNGYELKNLRKKELVKLMGGRDGCIHLIDLIYYTIRVALLNQKVTI